MTTTDQHGDKRRSSPPTAGLRFRPPGRATTYNEAPLPLNRRRSSIFSETLSETRRSLRSSTDDLLLPKAIPSVADETLESSHWHSLPLGLALLPAIAGVFFQNGSAIITDVTLLGLAAIFLNWLLRLPWDWYHAAQSTGPDLETSSLISAIIEEASEPEEEEPDSQSLPFSDHSKRPNSPEFPNSVQQSARKELRTHELTALLACFVSPVMGVWLLHAIRSQLSRPSEGLVSNYNLTIFLLGAELRPTSHLMKLVQRRTLFLQKTLAAHTSQSDSEIPAEKIMSLDKRLEDLEAHVADDSAAKMASKASSDLSEDMLAKLSSKVNADLRRSVQPELDALNRAMRRYEKRTTISAIQIEARFQELESAIQDIVVLAAAAQRSADRQSRNYLLICGNWVCAAIVVPVQYILFLLRIPGSMLFYATSSVRRLLGWKSSSKAESKSTQQGSRARQRSREKRLKPNP